MLRGGMATCGVIFHENINFLFVASGNFINDMVVGDQIVSTENEDGDDSKLNIMASK